MERLCFGTFINILSECKGKYTKKELVAAVIKTIASKCKYQEPGNSVDQALNALYRCKNDFSPTYTNIKELSCDITREQVILAFERNVIPLLNKDKIIQVLRALCALIKKDATLNSNGENVLNFQECIENKSISDFIQEAENNLAETLSSVFCYTVFKVRNTDGRLWLKEIERECKNRTPPKTYNEFFSDYVNGFSSTEPKPIENTEDFEKIKPWWEDDPIFMPDEFHKSFERLMISDFIELNPVDIIDTNYMFSKNKCDGKTLIKNAIRFVKHIESAMNHIETTDVNKMLCEDINEYINTLRNYINFLIINSIDSNPNSFPFVLKNMDNNELERITKDYREKLQKQYNKISDARFYLEQLKVYSNFQD